MAEKKGLLAILGAPEGDEGDDKPSTPKGRAMQAMWEALQEGDFEEAGHQFKTAYDLCAESGDEETTEYAEE